MVLVEALLIITASLFGIFYIYCQHCNGYWKNRNVPFKQPRLFWGNFLDILLGKDTLGKYIGKLYKEFDAPYFGIFILNNPILVVKDPNIIKDILVRNFESFGAKCYMTDTKIDPVFCNSLLAMDFTRWKSTKPHFTPAFTSGKLKMMLDLGKICGNNLEVFLEKNHGQVLRIDDVVKNFVTDIVSTCVFGIDPNSFENKNNAFQIHANNLNSKHHIGAMKTYAYHFIHPLVRLLRFTLLNFKSTNFFRGVFRETMKQRELNKNKRNDLIDILVDLKNKEAEGGAFKFDEDLIIGEAVGFFLGAYDSSILIISLTIYEICMNTDIQDRLRKEIQEVIEHNGVTYQCLDEMQYLEMVISETLRKYPIVNYIQRKCVEDYVVPETGLKIERNTNIVFPLHGLHFDETYFPDPYKYDPERFNDSNKHNINQYVYIPFSNGPRACIGKRFGFLIVKLALIHFLRKFRFEKCQRTNENLSIVSSLVNYSENIDVACIPVNSL